jgi:hypothetical protein
MRIVKELYKSKKYITKLRNELFVDELITPHPNKDFNYSGHVEYMECHLILAIKQHDYDLIKLFITKCVEHITFDFNPNQLNEAMIRIVDVAPTPILLYIQKCITPLVSRFSAGPHFWDHNYEEIYLKIALKTSNTEVIKKFKEKDNFDKIIKQEKYQLCILQS